MQGLLNNVTGGMAWAEGYSLALSLLFFLPAIIAFLRGHPGIGPSSSCCLPWAGQWSAGWRTKGG